MVISFYNTTSTYNHLEKISFSVGENVSEGTVCTPKCTPNSDQSDGETVAWQGSALKCKCKKSKCQFGKGKVYS